jgi:hypothetical protein
MANILDAGPDDVWIGRRVRLVFEDRAGGAVVAQFALA